ncbi:hypothetical protein N2W46_000237 [Clostridium perfringens]|nr:hypothetical protein [Clostridium perfringens]EJT6172474.1 hypothetical protein [Clostridium perfringens]EJT6543186.1 hypothetical protein [Clostridium perfringens]EJT6568207.1 hypothetical protein [Clostridium perfringens]MBS5996102.1 hypothetical protein [Clostridium perfringens]
MKAIRKNKVYTINETEKSYYIAQGYDILDDEGEIISYGAGKSVSYEEYRKVKDRLDLLELENEKLKEENKKLKAENKELKKSLV